MFFNVLQKRGFVYQVINEDLIKGDGKIVAYIGFDCTAKSLHVGSLVQIMMLRWLQKCGHRPIVLLGGGTTKIGDPSGKDEARQMLSIDEIQENKRSLIKVFSRFLDFECENKAVVVDNTDWLDGVNYIEFLRDYGKHFSINKMLTFESVKSRLSREQSLSFLEFNYMLLQAYDFCHLFKNVGCFMQMGGSDQWGNIVSGVELIKKVTGKSACGLTSPLLTTSSGRKMGKTERGAVWLSPEMLSAYEYWQFWRNVEDNDVGSFLKLFTDLDLEEISRLELLKDQEINEAKIILADEATKILHGQDAALSAKETARKTFDSKSAMGDDLPRYRYKKQDVDSGVELSGVLCEVGLAASNSAARRLIEGRGVKVNGELVEDIKYILSQNDVCEGVMKISVGKKKHMILDVV